MRINISDKAAKDIKAISGAVAAFEACSPSPESLGPEYLAGSWRLVYSSSLAEGGLSAQSLRRYASTVVDAPTARSRGLAIGECSRRRATEDKQPRSGPRKPHECGLMCKRLGQGFGGTARLAHAARTGRVRRELRAVADRAAAPAVAPDALGVP